MRLAEMQSGFGAWLRGDEAVAGRLAVVDPRGLTIYQNNYRTQLMTCLEESFPHTLAWLGEAGFRASAARHIDAVPPHDWTLDAYALGFPAGLHGQFPDDPEIAELAALELALGEAFVAGDAAALAPEALGEVDWDHARLRLVPSARLLDIASNAAAIWSALANGEDPPAAMPLADPALVVVWRQGFTCCFREAAPAERDWLPRLAKDAPGFGDICARLAVDMGEGEAIACAGGLLARWVQDGLLVLD